MKRLVLVLSLMFFLYPSAAVAQEYRTSARYLNFIVKLEFIQGSNLKALNLIFFNMTPAPAKAEEALKHSMELARSLYPGSDIMATAWKRRQDARGHYEDMIKLPDGSSHLVFSAKDSSVSRR